MEHLIYWQQPNGLLLSRLTQSVRQQTPGTRYWEIICLMFVWWRICLSGRWQKSPSYEPTYIQVLLFYYTDDLQLCAIYCTHWLAHVEQDR